MTVFDIFVLAIVGISALFALSRGFTTELLSLGAWAGMVLSLRLFFRPVGHWMRGQIHSGPGADLATLVLVGLGSFYLCKAIASMVGGKVRGSGLGPVDRILGMGFGVVRGVVIASLAYGALGLIVARRDMPDWIIQAKSLPLIELGANTVTAFTHEFRPPAPDHSDRDISRDTDRDDDGYTDEQRRDLERVLKQQQQQTPI